MDNNKKTNISKHTIPKTNRQVAEEVQGDRLALSLNNVEMLCSQQESVVWALCKPSIATLPEIQFQFSTLPKSITQDKGNDFIVDCIDSFSQKGFLDLPQNEQLDYPVDLSNYTHLMSSRAGVFAINKSGFKRIAYGMYFGICTTETGNLLAFDFPHMSSSQWQSTFSTAKKNTDQQEGVIRCFTRQSHSFSEPSVLHKNIASNCHHLVYDQGTLYGVDTEAQEIFTISPSGDRKFHPMFEPGSYHHINSLVKTDQHWLLLKSITSPSDAHSSYGVFDHQWNLIKEVPLNAQRAHDFLLTKTNEDVSSKKDDLSFWFCDSANHHIRHFPSDKSLYIQPEETLMPASTTRGLSETQDCWLIGSGQYGRYYAHLSNPKMLGRVDYINKDTHQLESRISVPTTPCCIIPNPCYKE